MAGPDRERVAGAVSRTEVLLFDLGGVLVDFVGIEALHSLTGGRQELEEIRRRWADSPALAKLEVGECSALEFARDFTTEWELSVHPAHFFATFVAWSQEPYAGVHRLLDFLRPRFTLACLTNINEAHWRRNCDEMGLGRLFDRCYTSHSIGLRKPDSRIYEHVVADLGREPGVIAFFDDTLDNVVSARRLGIDAHHVRGFDALCDALRGLGAIPPGSLP